MKVLRTCRIFAWWALWISLLLPRHGRAEVYALSYDETDDALVIRSSITGSASLQRVPACCAIASGSATFDTPGDRAWFIRQELSGAQLVGFNYVSGASTQMPLSNSYRISHMEFDASGNRLLALARDQLTDQLVMASINPANAMLTVLAVLPAPCCGLRTGVSALTQNGAVRMLVVGRNAAANEELLEFNFSSTSGPQASSIPAGLQMAELLVHPLSGALLGLAHDDSTGLTHPVQIGAAPGYAISLLGTGTQGCCFALAGAATVDRVLNTLNIVGLGTSPSASRMHRFDLSSGVHSVGIALTANALFEDSGVNTESLFANGFE